ncbi:Uu.00g131360.m01.CDS01 [Anthostomella pinea]|uniref:Uu.00g131360.m01.CDS01 n=1 Tax=Anthostomella pinea TaxID=933095 RepID=A0AAI8VIY3_9PEZI|nr:Uu.00g131360.m01.CDS01 [Anthostomella pinea]
MDATNGNTTTSPMEEGHSDSMKIPWHIITPSLIIYYLTLVRLLRFRAIRQLEAKYAAYISDPYRLNYKQAREIMHLSMLHDDPFLFVLGTQWALVKSYAMATGTPLLAQTRQLCDATKVGRRAEDTAVFLVELLAGDIDGARGRAALAKLNWIHGRYGDRIKEGDYVHTLALFVLEPQRWIARYGWRPMTLLERVAQLVYWREVGHRMGFGGIPATLEELELWKADYEGENMYFIPENRLVADATVGLFLRQTPRFLHGVMTSLFISFIEEGKVREALGYPDPPAWATALTGGFLWLRGFVIRHFFLPRLRKLDPLAKPGADGRLYQTPSFVAFEPWYVADTWYNRVMLWVTSGGKMKPGKSFQSRGYLPEELGPAEFEKASRGPVERQAKAMEEYIKNGGSAGVGCPFRFG